MSFMRQLTTGSRQVCDSLKKKFKVLFCPHEDCVESLKKLERDAFTLQLVK